MKEITVTELPLGTFMKLSATAGAASGLLVGGAGFIASLFGADIFIVLDGLPRLTGIVAGLASIPLMPLLFGLAFGLLALALYWPFSLMLRLLGGIRLQGH